MHEKYILHSDQRSQNEASTDLIWHQSIAMWKCLDALILLPAVTKKKNEHPAKVHWDNPRSQKGNVNQDNVSYILSTCSWSLHTNSWTNVTYPFTIRLKPNQISIDFVWLKESTYTHAHTAMSRTTGWIKGLQDQVRHFTFLSSLSCVGRVNVCFSEVEIQGESAKKKMFTCYLWWSLAFSELWLSPGSLFSSALQDFVECLLTALPGECAYTPHCTAVATEAQRS